MSKKIIVTLLSIISVLLGLWIWTLSAPSKSIVLGGSTSVNAFMQRATNEYANDTKVDLIYNSTGSQAGVTGAENNMYAAGFLSKEVHENSTLSSKYKFSNIEKEEFEKEEEFQTFVDEKMNERTADFNAFEFAIDAIVLVYNAPGWWSDELNKYMNFDLEDETLKNIYAGDYTWQELAKELAKKYNLENININGGKDKILTITRESGSGTRTAFSELTGIKAMPKSNVVNSNGTMFNNVKDSEGSIGYISYGFMPSVTPESGVKVAGINDIKLGNLADGDEKKDGDFLIKELDQETGFVQSKQKNEEAIKNGNYSFQRPFIAVFRNNSKDKNELIKFFKFLISEKSDESYNHEGLVKKFVINPQKEGGDQ